MRRAARPDPGEPACERSGRFPALHAGLLTYAVGSLFFTHDGRARFLPTCILIAAAALLAAVRLPSGVLAYKSEAVLALVVPIAGTLVALALPAAQLGQSVMEAFLSSAQDLIKGGRSVPAVADYLGKVAIERRRDLESIRCVIVFSIASLLLGLLGVFGLMSSGESIYPWLTARDLLASLATTSLVAAVAWLLPVVWSSFDFTKADQLIALLRQVPSSSPSPPPAAQAPSCKSVP